MTKAKSVSMIAKMAVTHVKGAGFDANGKPAHETVTFRAVAKPEGYPEDGSDEDNTFAKFTPSGTIELVIANPDLIGKFALEDTFYVRFEPVPVKKGKDEPKTEA